MRQDRQTAVAALLLAACSVGWLDPHARAREGNRLYTEGKFDEAAAKYNEALVDDPDSSRLHFNLGDAHYRQGKFDDALKAFQQIPTTDDDKPRTARVAYNAGNALYKLGAGAEAAKPQEALGRWAEAIAAYRRALGANPENLDAKFNHEFVARKIADLKKKLEEQQKQDEQKKQEQQKDQDQAQDQKLDQQQQDKDQQEQKPEDQKQAEQPKPDQQPPPEPPKPQEQQQAGAQPQEEKKPDGQQAAGAAGGEKKPGDMSEQEATALLDGERSDEVRPDEIVRKLQGAGVAEPAQDW